MTDVEQTLEILKEVGPTGIHSFELGNRVGTIRVAARVDDLKHKGYRIDTQREKLGNAWGVRYFLNYTPKPKTEMVFDEERKVYIEKVVI